MATRRERQPDALSTTSTHDTKRGEDARARLYALTEAPDHWAESVARWQTMNRDHVTKLDTGAAPEPSVEWMIYQALAGVWPTDLSPEDEDGLKALEERFLAYVEKALREAKLCTNWGDGDEAYEQAVFRYARNLLSPGNHVFLTDFLQTLQPFVEAGLVNGLTQTIIKLAAPGIPDIYQGSEGLDFSLVDPDNRREPDFGNLEKRLSERSRLSSSGEATWRSGNLKQHVIASLLRLRQEAPTLFREGDYLPLQTSGGRSNNLVAFARADFDDALLVIAPRLVFGALQDTIAATHSDQWVETEIHLPPRLADRRYRDLCNGKIYDARDRIIVARVFVDHPFAMLVAQ
jgi:(1->4)-alpha-D-glucan 1-alpha-D-glucosylmutase